MDTHTTRATLDGEGRRARPGAPGRTRPAGRRDSRRPGAAAPRPERRPTAAPHDWFARRLLAVLSGQRPVHSLLGLTVGEAYEQLAGLAPTGPLRERLRPVLRHCGRFHPGPGVIEAFARIATGDRVSAMAFRLEQGPDLRWRCAAIEIHPPRLTPTRLTPTP
ncbi:Rv3235 family protein [Streptomyces sp. RerS4]|uniref:Rv3235 family protein n=1 Tax=Streptomyces sp. RerS4 TaxID=2942449 RepID=UPI00201C5317|nr:Rv3235 family protein [Streptomyces sp. RerS4]UQX01403.1 Rv3235 family protein [Streptomyces sp. RerS4]